MSWQRPLDKYAEGQMERIAHAFFEKSFAALRQGVAQGRPVACHPLVKRLLAKEVEASLQQGSKASSRDGQSSFTQKISYEVKCDWMSESTGNACFEDTNTHRREHSGLHVTEADVWLHYLPGEGILILAEPAELENFLYKPSLKTAGQTRRLPTGSGDHNAGGYLVSVKALLSSASPPTDGRGRFIQLPLPPDCKTLLDGMRFVFKGQAQREAV